MEGLELIMKVSTLNLEEQYRNMLEREFPTMPILHAQLNQLSDHILSQVETVFTYGYDVTPDVVNKMERLKWLHVGQSGMDPLPFDLLREKGVFISNSRGINSSTIAEYVLAALLNIVRNTFVYEAHARQKVWDAQTSVDELLGKTVAIFGLGMVGREVAIRAKAFGMKVLGVDVFAAEIPGVDEMYLPSQRKVVLPQADFVVLCMPLLPSTAGMIAREELTIMKTSSWLINVGRGPLVNVDALLDAIDAKKIAGAVLDVFDKEPLPQESQLWHRENIWITPHTAGDHFANYIPRMVEIIRYNLAQYPHFDQMKNPVKY
jgi:Phosphoglycerate dehydrogenase and related dehydrogenases